MLENGGILDVIYIDFEKANKKVSHEKLLDKIKNKYGIQGKLLNWLKDFLSERKQQVLIEETKSE